MTSPAPRSTRTPVAESVTVTCSSCTSWPPIDTPAIDARSMVESDDGQPAGGLLDLQPAPGRR